MSDDYIAKYKKLSYARKVAHEKSQNYYSKLNNLINISNIAIVSLVSVANNLTSLNNTGSSILSVAYSIVLYMSVLVSSSQQFLKYEERAEKHKTASVRYNHLFTLLELIVDHDQATKKEIITEYENIYMSSPSIPSHLYNENIDIPIDTLSTQPLTEIITPPSPPPVVQSQQNFGGTPPRILTFRSAGNSNQLDKEERLLDNELLNIDEGGKPNLSDDDKLERATEIQLKKLMLNSYKG